MPEMVMGLPPGGVSDAGNANCAAASNPLLSRVIAPVTEKPATLNVALFTERLPVTVKAGVICNWPPRVMGLPCGGVRLAGRVRNASLTFSPLLSRVMLAAPTVNPASVSVGLSTVRVPLMPASRPTVIAPVSVIGDEPEGSSDRGKPNSTSPKLSALPAKLSPLTSTVKPR